MRGLKGGNACNSHIRVAVHGIGTCVPDHQSWLAEIE